MTDEEIIASGDLELYVCGALAENEAIALQKAIAASTKLQHELSIIESSYITLAENVAPPLSAVVWTYIRGAIGNVKRLDSESTKNTNWGAITGWAATIAAVFGLFWMLNQNNSLEDEIQLTTTENTELQENLKDITKQQQITDEILGDLRDDAFYTVPLPANPSVAPNAFAKVYYNAEESVAYVDANKLPPTPSGKVYQVWSLKMEPLTPNSMGLLETLTTVKPGLYKFENVTPAEGFGITLEPEGGSETPTLSQLYVLGTVGSTP